MILCAVPHVMPGEITAAIEKLCSKFWPLLGLPLEGFAETEMHLKEAVTQFAASA